VGFLDVLTGKRKLAKPAPDRLFAISTAYVTMETGLTITSRGAAANIITTATASRSRPAALVRYVPLARSRLTMATMSAYPVSVGVVPLALTIGIGR